MSFTSGIDNTHTCIKSECGNCYLAPTTFWSWGPNPIRGPANSVGFDCEALSINTLACPYYSTYASRLYVLFVVCYIHKFIHTSISRLILGMLVTT